MAAPWNPDGPTPIPQTPIPDGKVGVPYNFEIFAPTPLPVDVTLENVFVHFYPFVTIPTLPPPALSESGLIFPPGVAPAGSIILSGTPTKAGSYVFELARTVAPEFGPPFVDTIHWYILRILPAIKKSRRKALPVICCKPEDFIDGKCKPFVQFQGYKYVRIGETDCYSLVKNK